MSLTNPQACLNLHCFHILRKKQDQYTGLYLNEAYSLTGMNV